MATPNVRDNTQTSEHLSVILPGANKPLTQWIPKGGIGYALNQLGVMFQDNLGNLLITNSGNNIIPTPFYVAGKPATQWTTTVHA